MASPKRIEVADDFVSHITRQYAELYPDVDALAIEFLLRATAASAARAAASARFFRSRGMERTAGRFAVLRALFFTGEKEMALSDLSSGLDVTPANITTLVDGLEKDGYAKRVPHPTDRRSAWVRLTPKGEEVCHEIVPALADLLAEFCKGFSDKEKLRLIDAMKRLRLNALNSFRPD